jgi:hypothetical protein
VVVYKILCLVRHVVNDRSQQFDDVVVHVAYAGTSSDISQGLDGVRSILCIAASCLTQCDLSEVSLDGCVCMNFEC